jgi:lauroyl/myristoyl acyltransferase
MEFHQSSRIVIRDEDHGLELSIKCPPCASRDEVIDQVDAFGRRVKSMIREVPDDYCWSQLLTS